MHRFTFLLSTFIALTFTNCSGVSEKEKAELDQYQKCLDEFFEFLPMGSCPSFATDNAEQRVVQLEKNDADLLVKIQIPECLSQFEQYHSWIAAELQTTCLKNTATRFEFNDGGTSTYFSFKSENLPLYFEQGNRTLIIDKDVNDDAVAQIKQVLLDPKLPSEVNYYVSSEEGDKLQINRIKHVEIGRVDSDDEMHQLSKLSDYFKQIEFKYTVTFHTVDRYGHTVFSL